MSQTANITQLFTTAQDEQDLSPQSINAIQTIDIGQDIQAAMGINANSVQASSVILVQGLVDDSGSIRFAGNSEVVREGVNLVKKALAGTKQKDGILEGIRYLNKGVLCPFLPLDQVPDLNSQNYNAEGGTPLHRETLATLATVIAKTQEFSDNGVPVRSITFILTDGAADIGSSVTPAHIRAVVRDMLKSENHIICGIGIDDGEYDSNGNLRGNRTDFKAIFTEYGILEQWIIDIKVPSQPGETEAQRKVRLQSEIRKAFQTVSQSAVRASQAAAAQSFSQAALGGFGVTP